MKIKFKQDKETILRLLETSNIKKKIRVLEKLDGVNEKESIKILLKVLEDNSWLLREKAAHKLAQFGNRVVPRLERLLGRGYWYTRAAACFTLGEIGNLKALDSLISLVLTDKNPTVMKEASTALVKLAQREPIEFTERLSDMPLDGSKVEVILRMIEDVDPELQKTIKEELENE